MGLWLRDQEAPQLATRTIAIEASQRREEHSEIEGSMRSSSKGTQGNMAVCLDRGSLGMGVLSEGEAHLHAIPMT